MVKSSSYASQLHGAYAYRRVSLRLHWLISAANKLLNRGKVKKLALHHLVLHEKLQHLCYVHVCLLFEAATALENLDSRQDV